jgi:Tfp pilus assembly protein PilF
MLKRTLGCTTNISQYFRKRLNRLQSIGKGINPGFIFGVHPVLLICLLILGCASTEKVQMSKASRLATDLAYEMFEKQDYQAAILNYERAISFSPDAADPWVEYTMVLRRLNRLVSAARAGWRAVELAPNDVAAWNNLGNVLVNAHAWEGAMAAFQKVEALSKDRTVAARDFVALGYKEWINGLGESALKSFQYALKIDPQDGFASVLSGAVLACSSKDNLQEAEQRITKGIEMLQRERTSENLQYAKTLLEDLKAGRSLCPKWAPGISSQPLPPSLESQPGKDEALKVEVPGQIIRRYRLPEGVILSIRTPENWAESLDKTVPGALSTVSFKPLDGSSYEVRMSPLSVGQEKEGVRAVAASWVSRLMKETGDEKPELGTLKSETAEGLGFILVRKPPAGKSRSQDDFQYTIGAVMQAGPVYCLFTVIAKSREPGFVNACQEIFKSCSVK